MKNQKRKIFTLLILSILLSFQIINVSQAASQLITSWGTEHLASEIQVSTLHPTSFSYPSAVGETFQLQAATKVSSVVFYLSEPTSQKTNATYVARIYDAQGVLGSMVPGSALGYIAESNNSVSFGTVYPNFALATFFFSDVMLQPNNYTVALVCVDAHESLGDGLIMGLGSGYIEGNGVRFLSGYWTTTGGGYDVIFYLYASETVNPPPGGGGDDIISWIKANFIWLLIAAVIIIALILWGR